MWDLGALRQAPLVRGSAEALCGFLTRPRTRSIAVVGNGPLKPEQRDEIQGCDKVVRFNALNNRSGRTLQAFSNFVMCTTSRLHSRRMHASVHFSFPQNAPHACHEPIVPVALANHQTCAETGSRYQ